MSKPALFLDRDGVINVDIKYAHKKRDFVFVEGIFDLVKAANKYGFLVIVVTNQSGIARGYYSENHFLELTSWMKEEFYKEGAIIDAVYYCPHHPVYGLGEYQLDCDCRKPKAGMFYKAIRDFKIDIDRSIMIGNNETDLIASTLAGVRQNFFFTKFGVSEFQKIDCLSQATEYLGCFNDT